MNKSITHSQFAEYCVENKITPIAKTNLHTHKPAEKSQKSKIINTNFNIIDNNGYEIYGESYTEFCNDGQAKIIKDLRNNKYQIIATLDLHNFTQVQAMNQLNQFIENHLTCGNTCLKIIHGKGLNSSENKPVLKHTVRRILEHHPRLLAYSAGSLIQGGDGITLVKFKNK